MATPPRSYGDAEDWIPLPLDKGLFANVDPEAIVQYDAALENAFVNELGGISRFPGLSVFATLQDNGRVYLSDFEGDLIAATSKGQVYRVAQTGAVTPCTGVTISGGRRVIMAPTNQEMLFAAGGPIVRLRKNTTEALSQDAPEASFVGWIDGFAIANQVDTFNWFYSNPGFVDQWPALNTFSADSNPDPIGSILINPFREVLFGGTNKVEQWERLTSGQIPFFRRFAIGDGVAYPYCFLFADNAIWTINSSNELVKFLQQISQNAGGEIGMLLEGIDDWTDAWIGGYPNKPLHTVGQKFILFQAPNATTPYGTKGLTIVFDYRSKKFFTPYSWDSTFSAPTRWPGWSHWPLWNQTLIGGEGVIYQLTTNNFWHSGVMARWLVRTSHVAQGNMVQIKDLRLRLKRGLGLPGQKPPTIAVRCRRDAGPFGVWVRRDLGAPGDNIQFKNFGHFGTGTTFQWEIACTDDVPINLIAAEVKASQVGH